MFELVLAGYSNEAAVTQIKKEYGRDVPTNTSSIGWCRTQLKAKTKYAKKHNPKGAKVITDREARNTKASKNVAVSRLIAASKPSAAVATAAHKK